MNQKAYLKQINAMLQGRKIVKVEYMSKKDTEAIATNTNLGTIGVW